MWFRLIGRLMPGVSRQRGIIFKCHRLFRSWRWDSHAVSKRPAQTGQWRGVISEKKGDFTQTHFNRMNSGGICLKNAYKCSLSIGCSRTGWIIWFTYLEN
jgi:hypothetical protein